MFFCPPPFMKAGGLAAAFPAVAATNTSNVGSQTTHAVSMPSGISAGNLLIVIAAIQSAGATITNPSGWTQFLDQEQVSATTGVRLRAWYKIAAGGDTCSFSTSANRTSAHNSYRITGFQGTPEGLAAVGQDGSPNPPSLTPSWGENKTLFLAATAVRSGSTATISAAPSNYTDLLSNASGSATNSINTGCGSARRQVQAGSENPGTFTLSVSTQDWVAATIAIRPA